MAYQCPECFKPYIYKASYHKHINKFLPNNKKLYPSGIHRQTLIVEHAYE